jgi:hypothetical protein
MSITAFALALALLIGGGPLAVRRRAGAVEPASRSSGRAPAPVDALAEAACLDVLAVCLDAGMAVPAAARATATSAPPQLAALLHRAGDLLALGADPALAWTAPDGEVVGAGASAPLWSSPARWVCASCPPSSVSA